MITIFHGDNVAQSRTAYLEAISQAKKGSVLQLNAKGIDLNQVNNFLSSGSLFEDSKTLAIDNLFSISKPILDKLVNIVRHNSTDLLIWQDKTITPTQQKIFSQPKILSFKLDNKLFACLNSIRPHQLNSFAPLFEHIVSSGLFDLFVYLLKGSFRKQIQTSSKFDQNLLKKAYLQIIELEFQYKTGQLSLPRETALIRVLTPLVK